MEENPKVELDGNNVQITTIMPATDYVNTLMAQAQSVANQMMSLQTQLADIQAKITSLTN